MKRKLTKLFFINIKKKLVLFYIKAFNDRDDILNLPKYFSIDSNINNHDLFKLNDFCPGVCFEADVYDKQIGTKYTLKCIIVLCEEKEHSIAYLKENGLWYMCDDAKKDIYKLAEREIEDLVNRLNKSGNKNSLNSVLFYEKQEG